MSYRSYRTTLKRGSSNIIFVKLAVRKRLAYTVLEVFPDVDRFHIHAMHGGRLGAVHVDSVLLRHTLVLQVSGAFAPPRFAPPYEASKCVVSASQPRVKHVSRSSDGLASDTPKGTPVCEKHCCSEKKELRSFMEAKGAVPPRRAAGSFQTRQNLKKVNAETQPCRFDNPKASEIVARFCRSLAHAAQGDPNSECRAHSPEVGLGSCGWLCIGSQLWRLGIGGGAADAEWTWCNLPLQCIARTRSCVDPGPVWFRTGLHPSLMI